VGLNLLRLLSLGRPELLDQLKPFVIWRDLNLETKGLHLLLDLFERSSVFLSDPKVDPTHRSVIRADGVGAGTAGGGTHRGVSWQSDHSTIWAG